MFVYQFINACNTSFWKLVGNWAVISNEVGKTTDGYM